MILHGVRTSLLHGTELTAEIRTAGMFVWSMINNECLVFPNGIMTFVPSFV
jgi:hypothetical protein